MTFLYGRGGRLTRLFGGFRPGQVGVYLGYGLAQYSEFYDIDHVMILGRVSKVGRTFSSAIAAARGAKDVIVTTR